MPLPDVWLPTPQRARARAGAHAAGTTVAALLAAALPAVALTGCNQLEPAAVTQPTTNPAELYMRLTLNHPAVNLTSNPAEPGASTLQLVATPYDGTGAAISDAPAPVFRTSDTAIVSVTPDGLVRGRTASSSPAKVVATLVIGGVRRSDTAMVKVHDFTPAPVLDTFSLQVPPEQAVWYRDPTGYGAIASHPLVGIIPPLELKPRAIAVGGQSLNQFNRLAIDYESLDPAITAVDRRSGTVSPRQPGYVRVAARTMVFGVAKADTMTYTVQGAFADAVQTDSVGFFVGSLTAPVYAPTVKIAAGGWMYWLNTKGVPVNVTFDDPTHVLSPPAVFCDILPLILSDGVSPDACGAGNIATYTDAGDLGIRYRHFPVPGTYPYRNTTNGATGTIVVLELTPPPP